MHPELNWLGFPLSGQRAGAPADIPLGSDLSQSCLSVGPESPHFGCTWLRSVSCGRAYLKPNLLTVPRQAIFENNLEKVGLQGRVLVDFALSRLYNKATWVGFTESVTEQQMLSTWLYNCRPAVHFKARPDIQSSYISSTLKKNEVVWVIKNSSVISTLLRGIAQAELFIRSTAKVCCSYSIS